MASVFPNSIDNISPFMDIEDKDGNLIAEFDTYMKNGDFFNANLVLNKIENANNKIITATRLNQLRDCILALETFYQGDFIPYIEQKQNEWQSIINQFNYVGLYNSSTIYKINNIISYNDKGKSNLYIRIGGNELSGQSPTNEQYWRKLTVEGERGISSTEETTFYFDWVSSQTYNTNSIVSYNGDWWIATKSNFNSAPTEGNPNWQLIMNAVQTLYPITKNQPLSQNIGDLWFRVLE